MTTPLHIYLQAMRKDGTYADHVCLQALSNMLSAEIKVVQAEDDVILYPTGISTCTLVIGYLPELKHYVSLQPLVRYNLQFCHFINCTAGVLFVNSSKLKKQNISRKQ